MGDSKKIRVLVAKPGLNGHDRGAKVVARALRDAGMEVIYTGLHQTPQQIVEAAIQEDVKVVGLSILSGAHLALTSSLFRLFKEREVSDILVIEGGIISQKDVKKLKEVGVAEVFGPGTETSQIVDYIQGIVKKSIVHSP